MNVNRNDKGLSSVLLLNPGSPQVTFGRATFILWLTSTHTTCPPGQTSHGGSADFRLKGDPWESRGGHSPPHCASWACACMRAGSPATGHREPDTGTSQFCNCTLLQAQCRSYLVWVVLTEQIPLTCHCSYHPPPSYQMLGVQGTSAGIAYSHGPAMGVSQEPSRGYISFNPPRISRGRSYYYYYYFQITTSTFI